MLVEEGKLYGPDGQYVRDTTRQDHIDIITRLFQLSRNTGRFCTEGSVPRPQDWSLTGKDAIKGVRTMVNPVEACGTTPADAADDIYSSTCMSVYTEKTCLDVNTYMLYIRSRIEDLRGKRWITRVLKGER